jgi:hypothetical protein
MSSELDGIENATHNTPDKLGYYSLPYPAFRSNVLWGAFSTTSGVNHLVYLQFT